MTDPNTGDLAPLKIKTEVVDDEYEAASASTITRSESPVFSVYIDNAHVMSPPYQHVHAHIKEESVEVVSDLRACSNDTDSLQDNSTASHAFQNTKLPAIKKDVDGFSHNFRDVCAESLGAEDRLGIGFQEKARRVGSNVSSNTTDSYIAPGGTAETTFCQRNQLDATIKEEICNEEYEQATPSFNTSSENDSQSEMFGPENKTFPTIKTEDTGGERSDDHSWPVDYYGISRVPVNQLSNRSHKTREVDGHDSNFAVPAYRNDNSKPEALESCNVFHQMKFEESIAPNHRSDSYNTTVKDGESNENRTPCKSASKRGTVQSMSGTSASKRGTVQSMSGTSASKRGTVQSMNQVNVASNEVTQRKPKQADRVSSGLPKRGKKTQTTKPIPEKLYLCTVCSMGFERHKHLKEHSRCHEKRRYRKYSELLENMKSKSSMTETDVFECRHCSKSFMFAVDLTRHLKNHEEQELYEKAMMKYERTQKQKKGTGRWARKANTPLTKKPQGIKDTRSVKAHSCTVCGSVFASMAALQVHMRHPERPVLAEGPKPTITETSHSKSLSVKQNQYQFARPQTTLTCDETFRSDMDSKITDLRPGDDGSGNKECDGNPLGGAHSGLHANLHNKVLDFLADDSDKGQLEYENLVSGTKRIKAIPKHTPNKRPGPPTGAKRQKKITRRSKRNLKNRRETKQRTASVDGKNNKCRNQRRSACSICSGLEEKQGSIKHTKASHSQTTCERSYQSGRRSVSNDHVILFESRDCQRPCSYGPTTDKQHNPSEANVNNDMALSEDCFTEKWVQSYTSHSSIVYEQWQTDESSSSAVFSDQSFVDSPHPVQAPFLCQRCCKNFSKAKKYGEHCAVEHEEDTKPRCLSCHDRRPDSPGQEKVPTDGAVSNRKRRVGHLIDASSDCHAPFHSRYSLKVFKHGRKPESVSDAEPGEIVMEAFNMGDSSTWLRHSNPHRLFTCRYCESEFDTTQGLSAHQRVHIRVMPYECNQCTERFQTSEDLQAHRGVHSDSNMFLCVFCNALFSTVKGLNIHLSKYERENIDVHSLKDKHGNPVSLLVRVKEGPHFLSPVNCSSHNPTSTVSSSANAFVKLMSNLVSRGPVDGEGCCTKEAKISSSYMSETLDNRFPHSPSGSIGTQSPYIKIFGPAPGDIFLTRGSCVRMISADPEKCSDEENSVGNAADQDCAVSVQNMKKNSREIQHITRSEGCSTDVPPKSKPLPHCDKARKSGSCLTEKQQSPYCKHLLFSERNSLGGGANDVDVDFDLCKEASSDACGREKNAVADCQDENITQIQSTDTAYLCVECESAFPDKVSLDEHLKLGTPRIKHMTCCICSQIFICHRALKKHVNEHIRGSGADTFQRSTASVLSTNNRQDFKMPIAAVTTKNSTRSQDATSAHMCHLCGKSFSHGRGLWKHRRSHISERENGGAQTKSKTKRLQKNQDKLDQLYKCPFCETSFSELALIFNHTKMHTENPTCTGTVGLI